MTSQLKLKQKQVSEIAEQIAKAKTLMIVSIKSLPSKQFQEIKKALRGQADVRVAKKNILTRALKEFGKDSILPLKDYVQADCAFIISNKEGYELAGILSQKKTPVFAKAGQIAVDDIEVKEGPTDLVPGPAISELGSLGIQIAVEDGKISIKANKVVVNKGQEIKENAAALFQKLNIQPFSIGLEPVAIYDVESEKIYTNIKIDSEEARDELTRAANKALGFAQKIVYYCKDTIGYFLGKANAEGKKLEEFENKVEEKTDNSERDKEEGSESSSDEKSSEEAQKLEDTNNKDIDNLKNEKISESQDEESSQSSENLSDTKESMRSSQTKSAAEQKSEKNKDLNTNNDKEDRKDV